MRIFLVRHAMSQGNLDKTVHQHMPDHAIPLAEAGFLQAEMAKEAIENYFNDPLHILPFNTMRMWVSPYTRTRQTAEIIAEASINYRTNGNISNADQDHLQKMKLIGDIREDITLCEQQFGLFDGLDDDELKIKYPDEQAHYEKSEKFQGRFWARMPLGESRFDVAMRVHQIFGTWKRDSSAASGGVHDLVVVSHGVTIRAIVMRWLHKSVEWFEAEPNPGNCSIQLIENNEYKGFIFKGFDKQGKLIE